jgi:S1-C subfamily serine protease
MSRCKIICFSAFVAIIISDTAGAASKDVLKELGENLESLVQQQSEDDEATRCLAGIIVAADGKTVLSLGEEAHSLGVRQYDVILSTNGVQRDPETPIFGSDLSKGDDVRITVRRGSETVELTGKCPFDIGGVASHWLAVSTALKKADAKKCLERLDKIEKELGKSENSLFYRNRCYYAYLEKSRWRKGTFADYAAFVFAQSLFQIKSASYKQSALENLKPTVVTNVSWFESNNQHRYASELEESYEEALQRYRNQPSSAPDNVAVKASTGTCSAVSDDGLILTSEHVISGARTVHVRFEGEDRLEAKIEASSATTDLALLRVDRKTQHFLALSAMRSTKPGDEVFTYGYPASNVLGSEPKFTDGSISALSGPGGEATFLQVSVPIQPGNSGGPVVNHEGKLVGIVAASAAIEPFVRNTGSLPQNVNWAVKADYARLMFDPADRPDTNSREEAINLVQKAICFVEAQM